MSGWVPPKAKALGAVSDCPSGLTTRTSTRPAACVGAVTVRLPGAT